MYEVLQLIIGYQQLCCRPYFPQLWDVEKAMWSILIHTASWYPFQKYFKKLIKDKYVAIQLFMYNALQLIIGKLAALLQAVHPLYLFPTAGKCRECHVEHFHPKGLLVHVLHKATQLIIGKFAAMLQAVHQLYTCPGAVGCRESRVEHFDPNGQFVHLLEVF